MSLETEVEQAIRSLAESLRRDKIRFVLIGARVPEIIIDLKESNGTGYGFGGTADVDFAVQIGSWSEYRRVLKKLMGCGFHTEKGAP